MLYWKNIHTDDFIVADDRPIQYSGGGSVPQKDSSWSPFICLALALIIIIVLYLIWYSVRSFVYGETWPDWFCWHRTNVCFV